MTANIFWNSLSTPLRISGSGITCLVVILCVESSSQLIAQNDSTVNRNIELAESFKRNSNPDSAVYYYKKAGYEFKSSGEKENSIKAFHQAGTICSKQDRYEEARMYFYMAMLEGRTLPDTNDVLRAISFLGLGIVYNAEGDYMGSLAFHQRALEIRIMKLGEMNADVATSYGNIGNVYLNNKQYDQSIEAHIKARDIREKLFGADSPELVQTYLNLGIIYREKKEYETSLDYFQKALRNKILQYGQGHKDLVKIYDFISEVYNLMGDKKQEDFYKAKADEIRK